MSKTTNAPNSALSQSELGVAYSCMRKWAAKYAWEEWPEPPRTYFATGSELHKRAENYAKHGIIDRNPHPIGDMFLNALKHLAHPKTHWAIEQKMHVLLSGLPFELTADWYGPSSALPGAPAGMRAINDYKTSKDPKRYGVGIAEAHPKLADMQTVVYSHVLFGDQPGVFRHTYMRKTSQVLMVEAAGDPELEAKARKQPMSQLTIPSDAVLQPRDVSDAMDSMVLPLADRVYTLRSKGKAIDPLTMPPNPASCDEYGGCPHITRCNLSPAERLAGAMGVSYMPNGFDLFGSLAINGAPNTPAPAPAQAGFSFAAPATVPVPEELPPGYVLVPGNPDSLFNQATGQYAIKADVLAAFAAYKAAQVTAAPAATAAAVTAAMAAPLPLPVTLPEPASDVVAGFSPSEIASLRRLLSVLA